MEDTSKQDATLLEVANSFLANLPPEQKEKAQAEIYNLVRWLGVSRKASSITPPAIADYTERITPSAAEPIRPFLNYIHRKGFTKVKLASHVRAKRTASKTATAIQQIPKMQSTLSREGHAKMEAELTALKSERSEVLREVRQAAADKDFSENAPLQAAREHKSHLEGRIKELELILNSATVINETQDTLQIKLGNTVKLRDLASGRELRYTLADPKETNPAKGIISIASPTGKALLRKQKGQTISITAPAGTFNYLIEDIR
jgi:transcription elongation factor GreA